MTLTEDIRELESRAAALHNLIRVTRTNVNNQKFVNESILSHEQRIAWHQLMIQQLRDSIDNAPLIIERSQEQLRSIRKRINQLKHKRDVEKLLLIQEQINQLNRSILDEDTDEEDSAVETKEVPVD
jgi:hypothetical protein